MNAWTNLRLATIQADLSDRRSRAAEERLAARTRVELVEPRESSVDRPSDLRTSGWPLSSASRS